MNFRRFMTLPLLPNSWRTEAITFGERSPLCITANLAASVSLGVQTRTPSLGATRPVLPGADMVREGALRHLVC